MMHLYKMCAIEKKVVSAAAFFLFLFDANATIFYSRSTGVNWNVTSSWSTVTYGGAAASAFPVSGDTAKIADGNTIYVNINCACSMLSIGQGTSGVLQFANSGSYTLTVNGNISVNAGATMVYNNNSSKTHTLQIGGGIANNGSVDLYKDNNDMVDITFNSSGGGIISGSGTWNLRNVTLNKTSSTDYVEVQSSAFEAAITTLTVTTGTYIHNNSGSYSINSSVSSDFTIGSNAVFKVPQGSLIFSPNTNHVNLCGALYVNGGTVYIGTTAGSNGLRYNKVGSVIPYLEVSSGTLNVYGGISYASGASSDPLSFKMTGGTILLNSGSTGTVVEPFLINDVSASVFYMSGGTMILQTPNYAGTSIIDFAICGNNGTVTTTGGTIQFGNSSTATGKTFSFKPYSGAVQPNFAVTGPSGNTITLAPYNGSTADFKLLSLKIESGKIFDVRSYGGTNGDTKNMYLTSSYSGDTAFYNDGTFTARSGTVSISGTSAQSIAGSVTTAFYNLTIANTQSNVTLNHAENVTNLLTLTSGKLMTTATNIITCTSTGSATIGSSSSYVDGPMVHTVATASASNKIYPIGKNSSYRPAVFNVTHSNATSVTYMAEVTNLSPAELHYNLPPTLSRVSTVRYWNFTRQNVSNFSNATMQLYYDVDDSVLDKSSVHIVHDDGSDNWTDLGGTGTANITGNITSVSFNLFNTIFALGFPPAPLPIELVSFDAKKSGEEVRCEWTTATEINNDYFTIERSADGIVFDSLLYVKGAGNSSREIHYSIVDSKPLQGDSYYRLRQTNYDGNYSFSDAVHIYSDVVHRYSFFPNPSEGNVIYINKNGEDINNMTVMIQDMNGQQVAASAHLSKDKKELELDINQPSYIKNTFYIVSIISDDDFVKQKILISKR